MRGRKLVGAGGAVLVAVFVAGGCSGGAGDIPKGAACTVNGEAISKKAIKQRVEAVSAGSQGPDRDEVLDAMVQEKLVEQAPDELGVKVDDKDVQARIDKLRKDFFGGDEEQMQKSLKQQGTTEDELRDTFREQLERDALYEKVADDVKVGKKDVKKYYDEHEAEYRRPDTREVQQLVLPAAQSAQAAALATELQGADRDEFAAAVQRTSGAATGDRLVQVTRGQATEALEKAAFELEDGEVSRPVRTSAGWLILRAVGKVSSGTVPLKEVEDQLRESLLERRRATAMTDLITKLRRDAEVDCLEGYSWKAKAKSSEGKLAPVPPGEAPQGADGADGNESSPDGVAGTAPGSAAGGAAPDESESESADAG